MRITKKQLKKIIKEESEKLTRKSPRHKLNLKESITNVADLENTISTASVDIAEEFNRMMVSMVQDEQVIVENVRSWNEEVYRATMKLEEMIEKSIEKAVQAVEADLRNGQFSRK